MATAPETAMAAGISHATREEASSPRAERTDGGASAAPRRATVRARAAAVRLAPAAIQTVTRLPRGGSKKYPAASVPVTAPQVLTA